MKKNVEKRENKSDGKKEEGTSNEKNLTSGDRKVDMNVAMWRSSLNRSQLCLGWQIPPPFIKHCEGCEPSATPCSRTAVSHRLEHSAKKSEETTTQKTRKAEKETEEELLASSFSVCFSSNGRDNNLCSVNRIKHPALESSS